MCMYTRTNLAWPTVLWGPFSSLSYPVPIFLTEGRLVTISCLWVSPTCVRGTTARKQVWVWPLLLAWQLGMSTLFWSFYRSYPLSPMTEWWPWAPLLGHCEAGPSQGSLGFLSAVTGTVWPACLSEGYDQIRFRISPRSDPELRGQ